MESGPALIFGAYPAALSTIPYGLHWVRLLFLNMILLGMDSAFALVEAVVNTFEDSAFISRWPKHILVAIICTVGFIVGLLYTTDAALVFIDVVDFYVNFILLFLGFCKSFSTGWVYKVGDQMEQLGYGLVCAYILTTFGSILLASLIWFGVRGNTAALGFVSLFCVYSMGMAYCQQKIQMLKVGGKRADKDVWYQLAMGNVLQSKKTWRALWVTCRLHGLFA